MGLNSRQVVMRDYVWLFGLGLTGAVMAQALPTPGGIAPMAPQAQQRPVRLTIKPTPKQAQVQLLGQAARYSSGMRLPPGRYQVRVTHPDYLPVTRWVTLGAQDQTLVITLKPKPKPEPEVRSPEPHRLTVVTDPPGAQVILSDTEASYGQAGALLLPGTYRLEVWLPGHVIQALELTMPEADHVLTVKLEPVPPPVLPALDALHPQLLPLAAGCVQVGSPATEVGRRDNEVQQNVCVQALQMRQYEVTVGEFRQFIAASSYAPTGGCWAWSGKQWEQNQEYRWDSPGFAQTAQDPVVCVSWDDAQAYAAWLSQATGQHWRLPTEAEWEYAVRAQTTTARFWGEAAELACGYANVADQASATRFNWDPIHACDDNQIYTAPVGRYRANAWNLHDMLGNAAEWTCSEYDRNAGVTWVTQCARPEAKTDPRTIRGGAWAHVPDWVRSAHRLGKPPAVRLNYVGFRLVQLP